jgi:hypothetical protein
LEDKPIPFLIISGWRVCAAAVGEIGEAVVRGNATAIDAEESFRCFA